MNITKDKYYELMSNIASENDDFNKIYAKWKLCFAYILRSYKCGYNKTSINHLFNYFQMQNWTLMHRENSKYADFTKEQLIEEFNGECNYISDRASYDRLFRCHWLFKQAFHEELNSIKI